MTRRDSRCSYSWIFDYDTSAFEHYAEDRSIEDLLSHTESGGEIIVHRLIEGEQATDTVIAKGLAQPWPADEVLEIAGEVILHRDLDWPRPPLGARKRAIWIEWIPWPPSQLGPPSEGK